VAGEEMRVIEMWFLTNGGLEKNGGGRERK